MTVRVYRSSDAGAPTLSGSQGSLINVLSAVLTGPSFNGTGNAYGSTPCAGWTRPYTGTNLAAFRQPLATTNGRYLVVDEVSADSNARVTSYENMTAINAGTGQCPTSMHIALGQLFFYKSTAYSALARPWFIVATDKLFYLWVNSVGDVPIGVNTNAQMMAFGDFPSVAPIDNYNTILISNTSSGGPTNVLSTAPTNIVVVSSGHYVMRSYTQTGGSVNVSVTSDGFCLSGVRGSIGLAFPNPVDGKLYLSSTPITELIGSSTGAYRGTLPGLWQLPHKCTGVLNDGDVITNVANLPGRVFEVKQLFYSTNNPGYVLIETSDTW